MSTKKVKEEVKFEYEIGSNVVKVDGEVKYLSKVVWEEVSYEEAKDFIVE
ncbi:MAG: hypothetical protein ACRC1P_11060 [Cellulosilyticaceae bacterium]